MLSAMTARLQCQQLNKGGNGTSPLVICQVVTLVGSPLPGTDVLGGRGKGGQAEELKSPKGTLPALRPKTLQSSRSQGQVPGFWGEKERRKKKTLNKGDGEVN